MVAACMSVSALSSCVPDPGLESWSPLCPPQVLELRWSLVNVTKVTLSGQFSVFLLYCLIAYH